MVERRDKVNVLEQLLATLTGTCDQPHRPSSSSEDPPRPPVSVH
jgi:hypothetical protein